MPKIIHTIGSSSFEYMVPSGSTPADFVATKNPVTGTWEYPTVCMFQGKYPLRAHWEVIVLKDNDVVYFCEYPLGGSGGGSNPLRIIASIFIIAIAATAAFMTGGLSIFATGGALAGWGGVASAVVGGAVMMGGQMLMGALTPMPKVPSAQSGAFDAGAVSATYSWNPTGNQARMFQYIPEQFGKMKITPDYVARQWSQYAGDDMYVYLTYGLGRGESVQHQIYMGETLFWDEGSIVNSMFDEAEVEIVPPGQQVTIMPSNVESSYEVAGQELYAANVQPGYVAGPYVVNSPGTVCSEIMFDILLPNGVFYIDDEGNAQGHLLCQYQIHIRRIDDDGKPIGSWENVVWGGGFMYKREPVRTTHRVSVAPARYEAIANRTTDTDLGLQGRIADTIIWGGMRAILPGDMVYDQTVLALVVKATNELSQNATGNLTVVQTRKLPTWDSYSRTWTSPRPSRSFADAIAYACKAQHGGKLLDKHIDLDKLYEIDKVLTSRGWNLDTWVDGPILMRELLDEWCSAFTVIPRLAGTVLSFVLEAPNRPIRADFHPQNIIRDTVSESYETRNEESPDDIMISYFDETQGYVGRDVRCQLRDSVSQNPVNITVSTIMNRNHAHWIGIHRAKCNAYRRVGRSFETEGLGRLLTVGDICNVHWPMLDTCATVPVWEWDEANLKIKLKMDIDIDELMDNESMLYMVLTDQYGKAWGPVKVAELEDNRILRMDAADYASVVFSSGRNPFTFITSGVNSQPTIAVIQVGKEACFRMIISDVSHLGDFRFRITGMEDRPEVYVQDIPVPPWEYRQSLPDPGIVGTVYGISGRFSVSGIDAETYKLTLGWNPVPGAQHYMMEASFGPQGYVSQGKALSSSAELAVPEGDVSVRVAAVRNGVQGGWGQWSSTTVNIVPNAPVPVLVGKYEGAILKIKWEAVYAANRYTVSIYPKGATAAVRTVGTTTLAYEYPKNVAQQDGGPARMLNIGVVASNSTGTSPQAVLTVEDKAPDALLGVVVTAEGTTATISANEGAGEVTGYIAVLLYYDKFETEADVKEYKIMETPSATFTDLPLGPQYLAIAAKDAFFDYTENATSLLWSRVYMITIAG